MSTWHPLRLVHLTSAICSFVFLLYLPRRLWQLSLYPSKSEFRWSYLPTALVGVLLSAFLLVQFLLTFTSSSQSEFVSILSSGASLAAVLGLAVLLPLEQWRSSGSSDIGTLYLLSSIFLNVLLLTAPAEDNGMGRSLHVFLIQCIGQLALLILYCLGKRPARNSIDKSRSPEETNGVLARTFFTWINPILLEGYKSVLRDENLPALAKDSKPGVTRSRLIRAWEQRGKFIESDRYTATQTDELAAKPETEMTLPRALLKSLRPQFLAPILPRLFLIVFRYAQPNLIKQSVKYVTASPESVPYSYGYWLTITTVVIYVGLAVSIAVYQHRLNKLKLLTRTALVGLIHHKTMISPVTSHDGNDGKAVTLMSTDVDSLDGIGEMVHETWAQALEVTIGLVLLAREVGWLWPLPIVLIFLCSRVSRYVAKHLQSRQRAWNNATENRVAALSAVLSSMKIIKMVGFQNYASNRVRQLRDAELSAASKVRWMMVYYNASANALGIFSPAMTLALFAIQANARGDNLDAETAFTSIAILVLVTNPANMVMTIVPRVVAAFAGFERIQTYLLKPSLHEARGMLTSQAPRSILRNPISGHNAQPTVAIEIKNLTLGPKLPLENVSLQIAAGSVTFISGPVGSGKSSLLRTILGESIPTQGSVSVSTKRIGYCAQQPWLPNGDIKGAILGMSDDSDFQWYQQVTNACHLTQDFESMPEGDSTEIGSRGLNLSGGQRQRVALARALFARCKILLLDDVLSGLDGNTEQAIVQNLLGPSGLFKQLRTTVIIASNSAQYYHLADQIVVLGDRTVKDMGTWQELQDHGVNIPKIIEKIHMSQESGAGPSKQFAKARSQLQAKDEAEEDLVRQTGDLALYGYYFRFVGWVTFLLLAGCTASYSFFITISHYWLHLWTADEAHARSTVYYVCGYLLLALISWTSTNGTMWSTHIRLAPKSGANIHQRLLQIVISAPLSFFSATENGSILNRFSQDIQLVDKQLPSMLANMCNQIFKMLIQIALLFTVQKWLFLSLPPSILIIYIIQKVYLRASRQLRFLELESRALVFTSFLETVEGLETLRAFGWRKASVRDNIARLDSSQRPEFCLLGLQRWLNIVIDLLAAAIATLVTVIAVSLRGQTTGGQVGVALNIVLVANTTLLRLVESWTSLEISLGAISRQKMLETTIPSENVDGETLEPPSQWPYEGRIEFKNVTAAYQANDVVLRDINLDIQPGQKVVVCGRTGSGKSSLLMTLLRLLELKAGRIEIDGVDISRIPRGLLRQRCFITVSQDVLIFDNETLRYNLDPSISLPNHTLVDALTRTALWKHFTQQQQGSGDGNVYEENAILDQTVATANKLSFGQTQLFAMARALVKASDLRATGVRPVMLLDEATASLDVGTEATIYNIIETEFMAKGLTVIIVAHRAEALSGPAEKSGRDLVLWMRDGKLEDTGKSHSVAKVGTGTGTGTGTGMAPLVQL
ncbi:putative ABC transporter [Camillea tinctor]|nr:putative ABC transporter [Camillea tinctor]